MKSKQSLKIITLLMKLALQDKSHFLWIFKINPDCKIILNEHASQQIKYAVWRTFIWSKWCFFAKSFLCNDIVSYFKPAQAWGLHRSSLWDPFLSTRMLHWASLCQPSGKITEFWKNSDYKGRRSCRNCMWEPVYQKTKIFIQTRS
jgi:hypothetical protein